MARDALTVLSRIREAAVTETGRELAAALTAADAERCRLEAYRQHVLREQVDAVGENIAVFAAWLPAVRKRTDQMLSDLQRMDDLVLRLQGVLLLHRTEAEAVTKAIQRRKHETDLAKARLDQAIMDEVGCRQKRA